MSNTTNLIFGNNYRRPERKPMEGDGAGNGNNDDISMFTALLGQTDEHKLPCDRSISDAQNIFCTCAQGGHVKVCS